MNKGSLFINRMSIERSPGNRIAAEQSHKQTKVIMRRHETSSSYLGALSFVVMSISSPQKTHNRPQATTQSFN